MGRDGCVCVCVCEGRSKKVRIWWRRAGGVKQVED